MLATVFFVDIMQTITNIKHQTRNSDRVNIYLNDKYAFSLSHNNSEHLLIGQTLSSSAVDKLLESDLIGKAYKKAKKFIDYRPRSVKEVYDRLIKHGFEVEIIKRVMDQLQKDNVLDDLQFAELWVDNRRTFRPRSKRAIRKELMLKGVSEGDIEIALDDVDELSDARQLAYSKLSKFNQLSRDLFRKRMWSLLARNGFEYDVINDVVYEMIQLKKDKEG